MKKATFEPFKDPIFGHELFKIIRGPFGYACIESLNDANKIIKQVVPQNFVDDWNNEIHSMEMFEDDVWIMGHPKCGTTWTEEMVWLITHDLDYETAKSVKLMERSTWFEGPSILQYPVPITVAEYVNELTRPRQFKSHLVMELLPKQVWEKNQKSKIVYVTRNPKDVVISHYHHGKNTIGYHGTKEQFLEGHLGGQTQYGPFFNNLLSAWNVSKFKSNILFLTYEDMKKDLMKELKRVSRFFGKSYTEEQLLELKDHLSFEKMKKNPSTNLDAELKVFQESSGVVSDKDHHFIRKGKVGGYKEEMSEEFIQKFDDFIQESLKDSDFKFSE